MQKKSEKKDSWLVVANSSLAKIYRVEKDRSLLEIDRLEHPESRLHNKDLVSDKPGRDFESMSNARHSLEPHHSPKHNEFTIFARQLANYLEEGRNRGAFEILYLAASPVILGLLRQSLSPSIAKLIGGETDKDITHFKPEELASHLPFLFYTHSS